MTASGLSLDRECLSIPEWASGVLLGRVLSENDQRVAADLQDHGQVLVEELRQGVRVSSRAWVGLVRFDKFDVRITPKLSGDVLGLTQLLAFTRGLESLERRAGVLYAQDSRERDLAELLADLLARAVEELLRGGLLSGYQEREDELGALRGRLLVDRQLRQRFGRIDRLWCRFDEMESNTLENQVIRAALHTCTRFLQFGELRRRVRSLAGIFDEVCGDGALDVETAKTSIVYDRQNGHYRESHSLAWLILEAAGVNEILSARGPLRSFAFLLDMNRLFEEFVCRLVEHLFPRPQFRVHPQLPNASVLWSATAGTSYSRIRPDIVLEQVMGHPRRVAIDAKYKRYDTKDVSSGDLYQGLLYAQAYGGAGVVPRSLLIYPGEGEQTTWKRVQLRTPAGETASELLVGGIPIKAAIAVLRGCANPSGSGLAELKSSVRTALRDKQDLTHW